MLDVVASRRCRFGILTGPGPNGEPAADPKPMRLGLSRKVIKYPQFSKNLGGRFHTGLSADQGGPVFLYPPTKSPRTDERSNSHRPTAELSPHPPSAARKIADRLRSTSTSVVAHEDTLIRITV